MNDLPPGINPSDIPGNRPEDEEWEHFHQWIDDEVTSVSCIKEKGEKPLTPLPVYAILHPTKRPRQKRELKEATVSQLLSDN